jgi:3-oxoacyl-[acyl-carrier-protein] synthase II
MKGEKQKQCTLHRVVVTGLGAVSPVGIGVEKTWSSLVQGRSGIRPITLFDTTGFETTIAGEVQDFVPRDFLDRKQLRKTDRFVQFAVAASGMAIEDSGVEVTPALAERFGVVIGSGIGGLSTIEEFHNTLLKKGPRKISPFYMPRLLVNMAPGHVSMTFGLKGPNACVVTACASGNNSLASAARMIMLGEATAMLAGGAEAGITPMGVSGFSGLKALSTRNDEPEKASRPFDLDRDGFVMGEGAGVVVLEEAGHAMARGARIYAELAGYGETADAYHVTAPAPGGEGASRCMKAALAAAGLCRPLHEGGAGRGRPRAGGDRIRERPRYVHQVQRSCRNTGHPFGFRREGRQRCRQLHEVHDRSSSRCGQRDRGRRLGSCHPSQSDTPHHKP